MKEFWEDFCKGILCLWQFPQTFVACFLLIYLHDHDDIIRVYSFGKRNKKVIVSRRNYCFSLGEFIFVSEKWNITKVITHEYGHSLQSEILGIFYFIIFLLSVSYYKFDKIFLSHLRQVYRTRFYYNLPWEKWADYLAGLKRKNRKISPAVFIM